MKRGMTFGSLWIAWITVIAVFGGSSRTAFADEIPPVVRKALPQVEIERVQPVEISPTIYVVTTSQGILYLDGSGRYLFTGEMYDLITQENLTPTHRTEAPRIRFDDLPLTDAILYRKGKHKVAIFADPDCPYCRKLHPELKGLDADVYVFLFPLTDLHPLAYRKSVSTWCSEDRIAALDAVMAEIAIPAADCTHPVDRNIALGARLGIRATPTILLEDGRVIEGYRPVRELARMLERKTP